VKAASIYELPGRPGFVLTDEQRKLVEDNVGFAYKVASNYRVTDSMLREDLLQEAVFALMIAATDFDPDRGVKFISFAVHRIQQRAGVLFATLGKQVNLYYNLHAHANKVGNLPKEWSDEEVAKELKVSVNKARDIRNLNKQSLQIEDVEDLLHTSFSEEFEKSNSCLSIRRIIDSAKRLTPRHKIIIYKHYDFDGTGSWTFQDLGGLFNVSRERVRQEHNKAVELLRQYMTARQLKFQDFF
tara:strand:+ start:4642 stop:5367 length:726 start_codon:yes stop_codon:yes gene_type:complete